MDMEYTLAGAGSVVDHDPIAIHDIFVAGDPPSDQQQVSQDLTILPGSFIQRRDVSFRNNEHVRRRLRVDVAKRKGPIILKNKLRWNLPVDDFAKEAILHQLFLKIAQRSIPDKSFLSFSSSQP